MRHKISAIKAREIIDCRGFPTVEVEVWVDQAMAGRADVPAGRSTGKREALDLRDGGKRWGGQGTQKAVRHVLEVIQPALIGWDPRDQRLLDAELCRLDGTPNKSKLGANAIAGVSLAAARAGAYLSNLPFYKYINANAHVIPVPLVNLINGGKLTSNDLEIQEFIVMPVGARDLLEGLQICYEINLLLRDLIVDKYGKIAANVGDEGGFAPPMSGVTVPMEMLSRAVKASGYADKIVYGLDAAASHWYDWDKKVYRMEGEEMTRDDVIGMYQKLCSQYPIGSIEDPLMEDDFEGFALITKKLEGVQIVGDDLFTTNAEYIKKGVEMGAANAVLWKFNQVGTLTEALDAADHAYRSGYGVQVSERSGETEDTSIADLAVAINAGQIKTGTTRSERTAKYNQLLRIAEELGSQAVYPGRNFRRPI
ncbi:MAG: phosphopyruvate hydratase [Chloroflexi bacterium RBG_16_51_16]|nr:MAG: phosphopyruvate hydratase [Chloroflexi bacterium RBG_16_51_16]